MYVMVRGISSCALQNKVELSTGLSSPTATNIIFLARCPLLAVLTRFFLVKHMATPKTNSPPTRTAHTPASHAHDIKFCIGASPARTNVKASCSRPVPPPPPKESVIPVRKSGNGGSHPQMSPREVISQVPSHGDLPDTE